MIDDRELFEFLNSSIRSIWALELWLLLGSDPERCWTEAELVLELRASTKIVADVLAQFERDGLISPQSGCWRFASSHGPLNDLAARLAQIYRERPVHVMGLIRQDPVQSLANAFKLKGDDK